MANQWKERVIAYNKAVAKQSEKASDIDVLIAAILTLPPGQIKKIINNDDVVRVLRKYGYEG